MSINAKEGQMNVCIYVYEQTNGKTKIIHPLGYKYATCMITFVDVYEQTNGKTKIIHPLGYKYARSIIHLWM